MSKLAVVTGGGRGIGLAIARRLASEGFHLELCGLDADELTPVARELGAHAEAFDLRDRAATEAWIAGLRERHGRIDALVHNAGVGGPDPDDIDENLAHLDQVLEVNAGAVLRITRGLVDLIPDDGSGRIAVVASVLGKMGVPHFSAYCASKAAVLGLVRAMATDLAPKRIPVNAVCPGWTDTAMAQQGFDAIGGAAGITPDEARARVEKDLPLGRIVRPEEIAGLVSFLVGPDAGGMSGQAITMAAGDLQR